jgi:ribosome-associated protein
VNFPESRSLACLAARVADDKKAEDTLILDVGDLLSITDFFVVTSAPNRRLVRTIVESIDEAVRDEHGRSPVRVEGITELQWVLMDYGDVVVHVFTDEMRRYYEIERLYRGVPHVDWHAAAG